MSGGNLLVPIVAHVVYDLLTFLEVHYRATAQLETNLTGLTPEKEAVSDDLLDAFHRAVCCTFCSEKDFISFCKPHCRGAKALQTFCQVLFLRDFFSVCAVLEQNNFEVLHSGDKVSSI